MVADAWWIGPTVTEVYAVVGAILSTPSVIAMAVRIGRGASRDGDTASTHR